LENGQQFYGGFLQERIVEILNYAHLLQRFLLNQLFSKVAAKTLTVVDQEVRDLDCLVRMDCRFFVLVNLREQSADLHVRLALVLKHLKLERGLVWVVEEVLHELCGQVLETLLEA
jgi:hypothetical protein